MIKGGANAFLQMANTTREQFNKVGGHYKMHTLYKASNKTQANSMNNGAALALAVVTRGKGRGEAGPEVLPNEAPVVRGGQNLPENFSKGSGVTVDANGNLQGVSVNSAPGAMVPQLSQGIPNNQVGVTTVGAVREAGGDVSPSPTASNPNHCTLCGVTPQKANELFTPTIPNPSKMKP